MTNLEILKHLIGGLADISDERLQAALTLEDITHSSEYTSENKCAIYGIAIMEIQLSKGVKSFTEGGYSISYTDSSIPAGLKALADKSGCKKLIDMFSTQPRIKSKRRWR